MTVRRGRPKDDPQNLLDRCAVAFLSAVAAFVTGALLWLLVFYLLGGRGRVAIPVASFHIVWVFTAIMALLGFFRRESLGLAVLNKIWQFLYGLWRILRWPR